MDAAGTSIADVNFVNKIGGAGQYGAIGGPIYNDIMKTTYDQIFNASFDGPINYRVRINGPLWVLQVKT